MSIQLQCLSYIDPIYNMPPKVKLGDVMDALMDQRVVNSIAAKTSTATSLMIDELLTKKLEACYAPSKILREKIRS